MCNKDVYDRPEKKQENRHSNQVEKLKDTIEVFTFLPTVEMNSCLAIVREFRTFCRVRPDQIICDDNNYY